MDSTGRGMDELRSRVRSAAVGVEVGAEITLPLADSRAVAMIETHSDVLERLYHDDSVTLHVRVGQNQLERFRSLSESAVIRINEVSANTGTRNPREKAR
jgi:50S ribosomal subunit-associated GTPase HflX